MRIAMGLILALCLSSMAEAWQYQYPSDLIANTPRIYYGGYGGGYGDYNRGYYNQGYRPTYYQNRIGITETWNFGNGYSSSIEW